MHEETQTFIWLTFLWYPLCCCGLETKPPIPPSMPVHVNIPNCTWCMVKRDMHTVSIICCWVTNQPQILWFETKQLFILLINLSFGQSWAGIPCFCQPTALARGTGLGASAERWLTHTVSKLGLAMHWSQPGLWVEALSSAPHRPLYSLLGLPPS